MNNSFSFEILSGYTVSGVVWNDGAGGGGGGGRNSTSTLTIFIRNFFRILDFWNAEAREGFFSFGFRKFQNESKMKDQFIFLRGQSAGD